MRKIVAAAFFIMFYVGFAQAEPYDAFNYTLNGVYVNYNNPYFNYNPKQGERIAQRYLDEFAKDVGQAISGGAYGVGGNLAISDLNLMLSLKMSYQDVSKEDIIVRTINETSIVYPIIHAELGFMEKYDAIFRVTYFNTSAVLGGGLRYKVLVSEDEMHIPTVSVQSVYTYLINDNSDFGKFNAWNLKTGATAFFGLIPYIQPYVFLTYDVTALKPVTSQYSYLSSSVTGFGYGFGASVKIDMLNISASVSMYDGQQNISFGVFVGI